MSLIKMITNIKGAENLSNDEDITGVLISIDNLSVSSVLVLESKKRN